LTLGKYYAPRFLHAVLIPEEKIQSWSERFSGAMRLDFLPPYFVAHSFSFELPWVFSVQ